MPRQFVAELERSPDHTHVLLITTGSVASIKAPLIVRELLRVSTPSSSGIHARTPIDLVQQRQSPSRRYQTVPRVLRHRRRRERRRPSLDGRRRVVGTHPRPGSRARLLTNM